MCIYLAKNSVSFLCNIFENLCCIFLQNGLQYGNKQKQPVLKECIFDYV